MEANHDHAAPPYDGEAVRAAFRKAGSLVPVLKLLACDKCCGELVAELETKATVLEQWQCLKRVDHLSRVALALVDSKVIHCNALVALARQALHLLPPEWEAVCQTVQRGEYARLAVQAAIEVTQLTDSEKDAWGVSHRITLVRRGVVRDMIKAAGTVGAARCFTMQALGALSHMPICNSDDCWTTSFQEIVQKLVIAVALCRVNTEGAVASVLDDVLSDLGAVYHREVPGELLTMGKAGGEA
jgi:hypothetical protein